ncbi:hypothetical protein N0V90_000772 [Kalmusia sp. IMI 367209]|nr:hypothetical protein N0V90_000772 [Kalmusia sp. IMI 367209]
MGNDAARAPEHPPHVWEAQRKRFTQLYREEKKTLAEVRLIMSTRYGFRATERQYKRKIKQWKLEKHAKATEKERALISIKRQATRLEMGCVYKVDGKDIAAHKLRRYAKANKSEALGRLFGLILSQITCFLWLETWTSIKDQSRTHSLESYPTVAFRRWTKQVLMTTQLGTSHILLAMLYIYRLKVTNPSVVGKPGSEYRVLTIALMLANKFLDDNTYTNRTWAEVTGIPVQEVNVMEVDFLTNMRYSLMVSENVMQWWIKELGELQRSHFEKARKPSIERVSILPSVEPLERLPLSIDVSLQQIQASERSTCSNVRATIGVESDLEEPYMAEPTILLPSSGNNAQAPPLGDIIYSSPNHSIHLCSHDAMMDSFNFENLQLDADMPMDIVELDTPLNFWETPTIPIFLTMELPMPIFSSEDANLQWRSNISSELQEGPIPDLDTWLDSSLWEDDQTICGLTWEPMPLIEHSCIEPMEPPTEDRFEDLEG